MVYYNECDDYAVKWLHALIDEGLIAQGDVDYRSIQEVSAKDLTGYAQCHFFAGIGGWSLALRLADWPDDEPVWTGSCPCQPWSVANVWEGGGIGKADPRHLWPAFYNLIRQHRPPTVFGEQVANAIKRGWFDTVYTQLENTGYALGSAVYRVDAIGASHQRKRLYFVADTGSARWQGYQPIKRLPFAAEGAFALYGDPLAGARNALAGDYSDLLPCNGLSVVMERHALKGYGNAIVPPAAAVFIQAYMEARDECVD
jgi:DNA (cytosine-5)-methyltransferase 1